jgi:hypothetical protein
MTTQHDKAKRWRLRFSVRTLVILVTLVCCYAACWGPTKRIDYNSIATIDSVEWHVHLPLIISIDEIYVGEMGRADYYGYMNSVANGWVEPDSKTRIPNHQRTYFLWLFGPRISLFRTMVASFPEQAESPLRKEVTP